MRRWLGIVGLLCTPSLALAVSNGVRNGSIYFDGNVPATQVVVFQPSSQTSGVSVDITGSITGAPSGVVLFSGNASLGSGGRMSAVKGTGVVTLTANPDALLGIGYFFDHSTNYRNDDGVGANDATNVTAVGIVSLNASPSFIADDDTSPDAFILNNGPFGNAAATGVHFSPVFSVEEGGTGTAQRAAAVVVGGLLGVGAGWTVTDWTGTWMKNPASGGTYTNVVGLDCDDLTRGSTLNACVRSAVTSNAARYFLHHTGGAASLHRGDFTLGGGTSASSLLFLEPSGSGANTTAIKAQAQGADVVYTLPPDDGDAGEQLQSDGSGGLTWEAPGGIVAYTTSGTPATNYASSASTEYEVLNIAAATFVGSRKVIITVTLDTTDSGSGVENITWKLYRATTSCPSVGATGAPTGTALAPTAGIVTSAGVASQKWVGALQFIDSASVASTTNYCLTANRLATGTNQHALNTYVVSAIEYP